MFIRTTSINKLLKLNRFIKGVQGGSSAGKTFGIIPIEIDYATKNPNSEISIVAESIPHLKRGAIKDFKKIMKETGRWHEERWNATDFKYTFANGSYIEFFSADVDSKLRGARRDRLYMNEANNMSFHAYTELAMRTKQSVFLDWNPTSEFWFHTELMGDSNVDYIILTYKDNEAAPQAAIDFIERAKVKAETSAYWANWYNVYGLGQIGSLDGVIFKDWQQLDTLPNDARLLGTGLDFGFTNDPTSAVELYKWNDAIIANEVLYKTGLHNSEIYNHLKESKGIIYADIAEPKSISELRRLGMNISGAAKGKDSIIYGIQLLQQQKLYVTSQSLNLIKELRSYVWKKANDNTTLNVPIDAHNHAIDAMRYCAMEVLGGRNSGNYTIR